LHFIYIFVKSSNYTSQCVHQLSAQFTQFQAPQARLTTGCGLYY